MRSARSSLRQLSRPLVFAGTLLLAVFTVARLALFSVQHSAFLTLDAADVTRAFVRGAWFDLVAILRCIGVPAVLAALPVPGRFGRAWRRTWAWVTAALTIVLVFLLAADIACFPFLSRHFGPEILRVGENVGVLVDMTLQSYAPALLGFLVCTGMLLRSWQKAIGSAVTTADGRWTQWSAVVVIGALVAAGAHGIPRRRHLLVTDAYEALPIEGANLALNGPFVLLSFLQRTGLQARQFVPWDTALEDVRRQLFSPGEVAGDGAHPLLRRHPSPGAKPWNLVVVMLEGWSGDAVDVVRRGHGKPPLSCTPSFDALASRGWLYTRCYAAGQRTQHGLTALLAGMPSLPDLPALATGLEVVPLTYLPRLARENGMTTWLLQASPRGSSRIETIADLVGFQHAVGWEDFADRTSSVERHLGRGWDHELFAEADRRFARSPRPFFGFMRTETTHVPHRVPDTRWERLTDGSPNSLYLNTLAYADAALGEFFERARRSGYLDDTVFVVVSDHIQRGRGDDAAEPPSLFHIPCLLLVPGAAPREDARIVSQLDILPTLVDLLGWDQPYAAFGRSLLDDDPARGAMSQFGDLVVRVEPEAWVVHDLEQRIDASRSAPAPALASVEQHLLSFVQVATGLTLRQAIAR